MSIEYIRLIPDSQLPEIASNSPFRAVVIIESDVSIKWQVSVSNWLVKSGCLYMMAWGKEAGSWDDSVDFANHEKHEFGEIPEENFVMTTWHTGEPLQDVFWFAKNSAIHPVVTIRRTLLVHISVVPNGNELLKAYANA